MRPLLITAALLVLPVALLAADKEEIQVGFGAGSNIAPFGAPYSGAYQQVYWGIQFPRSEKIEIRKIAFRSNQTVTPGTTSVNAVIRLATTTGVIPNFAYNLGSDQMIVFAGWATTDSEGLLKFDLSGRPFPYNPYRGDLVVQIEVLEAQGPGGFNFGLSSQMVRVYTPLGATSPAVESAGLDTVFYVKVK